MEVDANFTMAYFSKMKNQPQPFMRKKLAFEIVIISELESYGSVEDSFPIQADLFQVVSGLL